MAEYWKSTPKYWCKFCKTHIRDTKFERQQHEATGRHQIAIQRSLRELHREREREDREKQRAKDEVARLNGVVGSSASGSSATATRGPGGKQVVGAGAREPKRQATVEERKKQLAQLAAMGVAVPDDYRREMAMMGEWQTVAVKPIGEQQQNARGDDDTSGTLNVGVRKRKKDDDEEDEGGVQRPKRGWGNTFKTYSSTAKGTATEDDIEALLSTARKPVVKKEESVEDTDIKPEPDADTEAPTAEHDIKLGLKTEEADTGNVKPDPETSEAAEGAKLADIPQAKTEAEESGASKSEDVGVVFKKRKSKIRRQN